MGKHVADLQPVFAASLFPGHWPSCSPETCAAFIARCFPTSCCCRSILGAAWGVAQVLFGLSIARLGQALGFAIIISLGSLGGTLVPLLFKNRAVFATSNGALILSGLAVMMAGIVLSARAGGRREQGAKKDTGSGYALALALAVLCGLLAPMINYSFVFGQEIAARAVQLGISPIPRGLYRLARQSRRRPAAQPCLLRVSTLKEENLEPLSRPFAARCRFRCADGRPMDGRIGNLRRRLRLPRRTRHLSRLGTDPDSLHHDCKHRRPARR